MIFASGLASNSTKKPRNSFDYRDIIFEYVVRIGMKFCNTTKLNKSIHACKNKHLEK